MRVNLTNGDMFLELDPCAGGAISALRHQDLDVLRAAPDRIGPAFDPLKYAAFPMVPFVGRTHLGEMSFEGETYKLPANLPPEPHAIHGHGWRAAWKVAASDHTSATLTYEHTPDAWPWAYTAQQQFELKTDRLLVHLSVTNTSSHTMPAGLGWHPYFHREGAVLNVPTTHQWHPNETTGDNRPTPIEPTADLTRGRAAEDLNLDTTFSVGRDMVCLKWRTHSVTMRSDPVFSFATIYVPPGLDYFCVEPISHAPNAVNSPLPATETGFRALAPGETLSGLIELQVHH
ncbi:MAG: aldose 1-epimerase [Pseudomonadota bacterium]